jgi:hypothetical protein
VVVAVQVDVDEISDIRIALYHHNHSLFRHDLSMLPRRFACSAGLRMPD